MSVCTNTRKHGNKINLATREKMISLLHFTVINLNGHMQGQEKGYSFSL